MTQQRSRWRRRAGITFLATALGVAPVGVPAALAAQPSSSPAPSEKTLDGHDRALVAEAQRSGKRAVTLLVAAERGRANSAVNDLKALGGVVESTDAKLDYVKVSVPVANAEKAAKLTSVKAVDVDGLIHRDDPKPEGAADPIPQQAPGKNTPRVNPYLPTGDTYAAQFGQTFGGWDGKGTTVAVLDSGVDLDTPALATTSHGERKIVDWYNANATNSGDGTWVPLSAQTYAGAFTANSRTWTAPATGGPYTFGQFKETAGDLGGAGSETGGDLNRDGDRADSWGVLLDTATKQVRVDLNGNGDFTDEKPMSDYAKNFDVGYFGTDDPATDRAERMAFVVQTDKPGFVNIGLAGAEHGSHVAGIAAGNDLFGGKMDGAAPGAKLMAVKVCLTTDSCTASGLVDGVVYAASHGADVINISIGGLPALNDGNNARAELYNRTIAEYNVQIFISAGNSGAGANSVGDPSVATDAISVGSYITRETWLSNYGSKVTAAVALHPFSSRGPREDGGFKPDIIAPGAAISTVPRWEAPGPVAGTYSLPAGYAMLQGTSMASPEATGAAALLVSAYKATHHGRRPPVAALRSAIKSTARFVPGIGAYEQGAGLFNVPAAWVALSLNPKPDTLTTSVDVHTVQANLLKPKPGAGVGIHDREGVTVGQAYTRTYTITRTTGSSHPVVYFARWVGNDGTFSSGSLLSLPLNKPVSFQVKVNPKQAGVHSALLDLDNPLTIGVDLQTMNTVFAPAEFAASGTFEASGTVARNQSVSYFLRVPQGASSLQVDLTGGGDPGKGQVRFLRYDPTGVPVDSNTSTNCYNPDAGAGCTGGTPTSRTLSNPLPGVWEITVEARRTSDVDVAPFKLTASALGTAISPNPDDLASAPLGTGVARTYTVKNTLKAFTGHVVGGPFGSAAITRPSIKQDESAQTQIVVPAGSSSLTVTIGNPADAGADLDLTVYNCTSGSCVQAGQSADGDSEESVTLQNPAAGNWLAVVDGYSVPAGTTAYDYLDAFVNPAFGAVAVTDPVAAHASGSTWTVPGVVTASQAPGAGRVLRGLLSVVDDAGKTVGSGTVLVRAVS
ncbi:S8 family serine peptidase [Amycolatopsis sp. FDAARGOS 1241]|uniref:S8 family serine peptidase n=1 Tax=Amycolatopsis sp. FDAARGOS 1241 TaxID=2778070 RepID=UPI0019527382|nr:S8 family serine peptidase [Amycolatopsis sp. FDAARGOS 1241]QRP48272.1 S8 family serine peptidase [Amycolatopsis sp. FDAARGOS 1241]